MQCNPRGLQPQRWEEKHNSVKYLRPTWWWRMQAAASRPSKLDGAQLSAFFLSLARSGGRGEQVASSGWKVSFHQNCCRWFSCSTRRPTAPSVESWQSVIIRVQEDKHLLSQSFQPILGMQSRHKTDHFGKASLRRRLMLCKPWWDLVRRLQYGRVKGKRRLFRFSWDGMGWDILRSGTQILA